MSGVDFAAENGAEQVWWLDVAAPDWLDVPVAPCDAAQWRGDVTEILALLESVDTQLEGEEGVLAPRGPLDLGATLDGLVEFAAALAPGQRLVLGLAVPGRWPLPVVVEVSLIGDDPEDLMVVAGARGGLPIETPIVESLAEEFGDGIRVTRFDLDDDAALWVTVTCAQRRATGGGEIDSVLTWRTTDLELVPLFSEHLETLYRGIRIGEAA